MVQRKVIWTATAIKQRRAILDYWYQRNKSLSYPRKLIKNLKNRIHIITEQPHIFPETSYPGTRVTNIGNFRLFYKIEKDAIVITAFWDNRQNPDTLKTILDDEI